MLFQHLAKKDLQVAVEINESEAQFPWRAFICTKRHLLCVLPSWGRHHFKSSLHLLVIFHAYCVVIHAVYTVPAAMWQPHFSTGIKHIKWVSYVSDTQSVPELNRMSTHFLNFKVVFQHLSKYFLGHWLLFPLIFSPVLVPCVAYNRQGHFYSSSLLQKHNLFQFL